MDLRSVNVQLLADRHRQIFEVLLDLVHHGELSLVTPGGAGVAFGW